MADITEKHRELAERALPCVTVHDPAPRHGQHLSYATVGSVAQAIADAEERGRAERREEVAELVAAMKQADDSALSDEALLEAKDAEIERLRASVPKWTEEARKGREEARRSQWTGMKDEIRLLRERLADVCEAMGRPRTDAANWPYPEQEATRLRERAEKSERLLDGMRDNYGSCFAAGWHAAQESVTADRTVTVSECWASFRALVDDLAGEDPGKLPEAAVAAMRLLADENHAIHARYRERLALLENRLADAWYSFEPAYEDAKSPNVDLSEDGADWWDSMDSVRAALLPSPDREEGE